jgi:hypothetical protein
MNGEDCKCQKGFGVLIVAALFVVAGVGARKKRCHCAGQGEKRCDGNCQCRGRRRHEDGRNHGHSHGQGRRGFDPMRILDKRFASGEIDEEEYQRRRSVLKGEP